MRQHRRRGRGAHHQGHVPLSAGPRPLSGRPRRDHSTSWSNRTALWRGGAGNASAGSATPAPPRWRCLAPSLADGLEEFYAVIAGTVRRRGSRGLARRGTPARALVAPVSTITLVPIQTVMQIDDLLVQHAEAARRHRLADGLRRVGAVNAIEGVAVALVKIRAPARPAGSQALPASFRAAAGHIA